VELSFLLYLMMISSTSLALRMLTQTEKSVSTKLIFMLSPIFLKNMSETVVEPLHKTLF